MGLVLHHLMRKSDYSAPPINSAACAGCWTHQRPGAPQARQRPPPASTRRARLLVIAETVSIVFGGLVPGFLLGILAFRVKSRWCPRCGASTEAMHHTEDR
ncbi:hypothetical protein GVV04_16775 [Micromonospora sp. NEAU-HG-1]|nr:hypothetical protein [Micromonospora rubida]